MDHTIRQLKLLVPSIVVTYYLGTLHDFAGLLRGEAGYWPQLSAYGASFLGITTIALFIYVLLLPWISGEEPDYKTWKESGTLSGVIPLLTGSIAIGWVLSVGALGHWSAVGYLKGTIGVSAFYALTFSLLGLLPVPRPSRRKAKL